MLKKMMKHFHINPESKTVFFSMKSKFVHLVLLSFLASLVLFQADVSAKEEPIREDIEWLDVWLPNTNNKDLPRVLLIGDSITRAYYPEVENGLRGKAYVGRLSTSKSIGDPALLDEVALILKSETFNIIHFNNGLHGWGYTEEQYRKSFPDLIKTIKKHAPKAKLIWASTTPIRNGEGMNSFEERTERVKVRNRIAQDCIKGKNIETDDLFGFVENHPEYYAGGDGTHLVSSGVTAMAKKVVESIDNVLITTERK